MMNKVQTFDQIIPCDFQLLSQCGGKSANSMTWNNWNVHTWGTTVEYKLTPTLTLKGRYHGAKPGGLLPQPRVELVDKRQ